MNKPKRLRVFAGPNGSGKTTLAKTLSGEGKFHLKHFVNADEIEFSFEDEVFLDLNQFGISTTTDVLLSFLKEKGMSIEKTDNSDLLSLFEISQNKIYFKGKINSYISSDIATFIREALLEKEETFAFETVFSHRSKLEFMMKAKEAGYKVYFYFLATDDPIINVNRVNIRIEKRGHPVSEQKITDRYYRSLGFLFDAVKVSSRAYLFDNSGKYFEMIAEIENGKNVEVLDLDKQIPNWFIEYFYDKAKKE